VYVRAAELDKLVNDCGAAVVVSKAKSLLVICMYVHAVGFKKQLERESIAQFAWARSSLGAMRCGGGQKDGRCPHTCKAEKPRTTPRSPRLNESSSQELSLSVPQRRAVVQQWWRRLL
jgi:hypothetical protein